MKITNKMKEHGSFTFEKKGQLITSRANDAWNKETSQEIFTAVQNQFFKTEEDAIQWLKSNGIE